MLVQVNWIRNLILVGRQVLQVSLPIHTNWTRGLSCLSDKTEDVVLDV